METRTVRLPPSYYWPYEYIQHVTYLSQHVYSPKKASAPSTNYFDVLSAPTTWSRVNDVLSNVDREVASAEQPSVAECTLRSLALLREADPSLIPDVVVSGLIESQREADSIQSAVVQEHYNRDHEPSRDLNTLMTSMVMNTYNLSYNNIETTVHQDRWPVTLRRSESSHHLSKCKDEVAMANSCIVEGFQENDHGKVGAARFERNCAIGEVGGWLTHLVNCALDEEDELKSRLTELERRQAGDIESTEGSRTNAGTTRRSHGFE
jgi:hypothetical protein